MSSFSKGDSVFSTAEIGGGVRAGTRGTVISAGGNAKPKVQFTVEGERGRTTITRTVSESQIR